MKVFSRILAVLIINVVAGDDGFIAFWAPVRITDGNPLSTTIFSSNLPDDIKVGIQYRSTNSKFVLKNDEFKTIDIKNGKYMARSGSTLNLTFYRSVTTSGSTKHQCSTKSLKILPEQRNFYIFIQTDKPIYKPGDEVKFRILVIDNDMKPFHMNNLKVDIFDPFGRIIETFSNIEGQFLGLFENTFKLSSRTILGDWKIKSVVDSKEQYGTEKSFAVQKYILPLFEVNVETDQQHYLLEHDVKFVFYAKYSFGEFVTGNAELIIRNQATGYEYLKKSFSNVGLVESFSTNLKFDLQIATADVATLEAIVTYSEPESGLSFNKSTTFYVHNGLKYKVTPFHPSRFSPDSRFTVTVHVTEWNGEKFKNQDEKVEMKFSFTTSDYENYGKIAYMPILDGVAAYDIDIPNKAELLHVEVKFTNSKNYVESEVYRARIEPGNVDGGMASLDVEHEPKNPRLHDRVKITVKSDSSLDKVLSVTTNKLGNIQYQVVDCNNNLNCEYYVDINENMMPNSTVTVYNVVDKSHIYQGSTSIGTELFEAEHLNFKLSKTDAKPKDKIQMNFSSTENSTIYLLAFDKNLKFLRDGNDITKGDVSSALGEHDGKSQLIVNDFTSWTECTDEELQRVGVVFADSGVDVMHSPDFYEPTSYFVPKDPEVTDEPPVLRKDFPETWIFESFEVGNQKTAMKEFTAPDSITTWQISAFSLNQDKGLAIAPPQDLKVMNQFFIRMDLPYSIKYMEVLRLDILVFNYIETEDFLKAEVKLDNFNGQEFQFVEFSGIYEPCTPSYSNKDSSSETSAPFPHKSVKKISFYIRPNPSDNEFDDKVQKKIKLKVSAIGYGRYGVTYHDEIEKELLVEPAGVSDFIINTQDYKLDGVATNPHVSRANFTQELKGVNVIVGGDYMSNSLELSSRFEFYPTDCLEQRTSKLKGNVEYFRYRQAKESNPSTKQISDYYQTLLEQRTGSWNYGSSVGYRAYFLEAIASAMEIGALPKQSSIIQQELDFLKDRQQSNGEFENFGNFPSTEDKYGTPAASYFKTAFVLIPFLKFKTLVDKHYDDVVQKGFDYLKSNENRWQLNNEGYPVAAYAYALNNDKINAHRLLFEVEKLSVDQGRNKKCYKVSRDDLECQVRHTTYAALAYIQLNEISKALPIVKWLLTVHNINFFYSNTYDFALTTEPIAKLAKHLKTDQTQLTVTLKNERNFQKIVDMNDENSAIFQDIQFPQYSQDVISTANGHGYCSITTIFERSILLPKVTRKFKLTVTPIEKNDKERLVNVCAEYVGNSVVMNAIYEIELPSGYIYTEIMDIERLRGDIKLITEKRGGTLIYIYYNDFVPEKKYCVDVIARKAFDVKNAKLAGVKVYDYINKQNIAIEFYKYPEEHC